MGNVYDFPYEQVERKVFRERMTDRLRERFNEDDVYMILEEIDEIINVSQFTHKEIIDFYKSIHINSQFPEIIGVLNDS